MGAGVGELPPPPPPQAEKSPMIATISKYLAADNTLFNFNIRSVKRVESYVCFHVSTNR
jgi:hypothetical protein